MLLATNYGAQKPPLGVPLAAGHPLAQGLVAAYVLNEQGGSTLVDVSGGSGAASAASNPVWSPPSLKLDGSTQYATLGGRLPSLAAFTVSVRARLTVLSSYCGPVNNRVSGVAGFQLVNEQNGGGSGLYQPHLVVWSGSAESSNWKIAATYATPWSVFHDIVWSWDGTTARCWVDGASQTVAAGTSGYSTNGAYLGRGYTYCGGYYDRLYIWNRPLGAGEVAQLYAKPFAMFGLPRRQFFSLPAAGGTNWTLTLAETFTLADALLKGEAKVLSEAVGLTDTLAKGAAKLLGQTLTLTDIRLLGASKSLTESLVLTDLRTFGIAKLLAEALGFSDVVSALKPLALIITTYSAAADAVLSAARADPVSESALGDGSSEGGGLA